MSDATPALPAYVVIPRNLPGTGPAYLGVAHKAFETLRVARGEEHSEEENQRLYEFSKKLRAIEVCPSLRTIGCQPIADASIGQVL